MLINYLLNEVLEAVRWRLKALALSCTHMCVHTSTSVPRAHTVIALTSCLLPAGPPIDPMVSLLLPSTPFHVQHPWGVSKGGG